MNIAPKRTVVYVPHHAPVGSPDRPMKTFASTLLLVLAGVVLGAWLQRTWDSTHPPAPKVSEVRRNSGDETRLHWRRAARPGESLARESSSSPATRDDQSDNALKEFLAALEGQRTPRLTEADRARWLRLADQLSGSEATQVLASLRERPTPPGWETVLVRLWSRSGDADPAGTYAQAAQLPRARERDLALEGVLETWVRQDRVSAISHVQAQTDLRLRSAGIKALVRALTESDPREAVRLVQELPRGRPRIEAELELLGRWASQDPAAAATHLASRPITLETEAGFEAVTRAWAQADPAAAHAWAMAQPPSRARSVALNTVFPALAEADPKRAAEMLASLPEANLRRNAAEALADAWAQRDPKAAAEWWQGLSDVAEKARAFTHLIDRWAETDAAAAAAFLAQVEGSLHQERAIESIAAHWSTTNPQAALAWARELPEEAQRSQAVSTIVRQMATTSPREALVLAESIPEGDSRRNVTVEIVRSWAQNDPTGVATWAGDLPESSLREQALGGLGRDWGFSDPDRAVEWLGALPSGSSRDSAIEGFVSAIDGYDARLGTLWADKISDPGRRVGIVAAVARRWLEGDPGGARKWIEGANLPPEVRAALLPPP